MPNEVLISLSDISKTYIMGEVKVEALKATSLEIYQGELLVILGPSGSGKSTLLNLIGGIDTPTSGQMLFGKALLSNGREKDLTRYRRQEVGFVFQFYNLIADLTAAENVALAAELVAEPLAVDDVLRDVNLWERRDHFPSQLSGGEQQRVAIARAMVKSPRLLLCDEPTGALDFETGKMVLRLLRDIQKNQASTVIIVTHNTAIADIADRVLRMRSGSVAEIIINENPLPPERIEW
ncbi:ABC transporter ATP-binding protein [Syntrophomonas wolfei]|uniref:ATPase n=1 Tax=Syntrophomonas wolfei subsp. wolfei (strain DSM 2245B / Goettingen) TaxID=335541 RepID=Q0AW91_SYNWW|nr:ABC transporter ATP-binding protein [Syntrophomonas wolfei]ABI69013.1 ATPase [Syntrophomonas wolfei subsp. wolfei str. Goettingen G311]